MLTKFIEVKPSVIVVAHPNHKPLEIDLDRLIKEWYQNGSGCQCQYSINNLSIVPDGDRLEEQDNAD